MQCFFHPETSAAGVCGNCGKFVCRDCARDLRDRLLCPRCSEIADQEQQAQQSYERAVQDRISARATLKLRIGKFLFWGTLVFSLALGLFQVTTGDLSDAQLDPRLSEPGGVVAFLVALPFGGLIAAYVIWSFYWGEIAVWRFWINLIKKFGWSIQASIVGWVILLLVFMSCPYMLGIFYGVFGGGIVEYVRTKKVASESNRQDSTFRYRTILSLSVGVGLALLAIFGGLLVARHFQVQPLVPNSPPNTYKPDRRPSSTLEPINESLVTAQSALAPIAEGLVLTQQASEGNLSLDPITDQAIASHLTRQIRARPTDTNPLVVTSIEGETAWINLKGIPIELMLDGLDGNPSDKTAGNNFRRHFINGNVTLSIEYEVLAVTSIEDLGCERTEYRLDIRVTDGDSEGHIVPESYGEGC